MFHSWRGLGEDLDDQPEAGWIIAAVKAGQGYAGEAIEAALAWFDAKHCPRRTVCMIDPANAPSIWLAERFGYAALRATEFGGGPVKLFAWGP